MMTDLSITQRKLRMLCDRALRVHDRHAKRDLAINALGFTLVPAAKSFIKAYDDVIVHEIMRKAAMAAGREAVDALHGRMRCWLPVLEVRIWGDSYKPVAANPASPDQVIGDAQRLIASVNDHRDDFADAQLCVDTIGDALASAQRKWGDAQAVQVKHQALQSRARELGTVANAELIVLRKVLRIVLGQSHHDYQTLRGRRTKQVGAESEEVIEVVLDELPRLVSLSPRSTPPALN